MKRVFWILITPLMTLLVLGTVFNTYALPRLEKWSLRQALNYINANLPVNVQAEALHLHFLKPSLALDNIRVSTEDELEEIVPFIQIKSALVRVDPFQLLLGRISLAAVIFDSPEFSMQVDPLLQGDEPAKALPIDKLFDQLEQLPVERVFVRNLNFKVDSQKLNLIGDLQSGDLLLTNMGKNVTAKLSVTNLGVTFPKIGRFGGGLNAHLLLNRQALKILQLNAQLNESEASLHGEISPISEVTLKPQGVLNLDANLQLSELHKEIRRLQPNLKIPNFSGSLNLELDGRLKGDFKSTEVSAIAKSSALKVAAFELGDARIEGQYSDNKVKISEVEVLHPAGKAKITSSQIAFDESLSFKALVQVEELDVHRLFDTLNLEKIPVGMGIQGRLPCQGQLQPEILLSCDGVDLTAKNLWVKSDVKPKTPYILQLDEMKAAGSLSLTTAKLTYKADVQAGTSNGTSEGQVDFKKGFEISYKTPGLDFKNVRNLANLKIVGVATIEGTTSGDSHAAVFSMKANGRNFIFEDFFLGNLITDLSYKSGVLNFENVAGAIEKTQYLGELAVDLNDHSLRGEVTAPTVDLKDVVTLLSDFYHFPLAVQGQGSAKAQFSGPLDFWKMNYKVESAFKKPDLEGEQFDSLTFNVQGDHGTVKTDNVVLKKGNSSLVLRGEISSEKKMNLFADGKAWRLENSTLISKMNSAIVGELNLAAELKGPVASPQVLVKGAVTDTLFEEQEVPNSNFIINLTRDEFATQLSLFGSRVLAEFQIPLRQNKTPLLIKLKTQKWDYSDLLSLVGGASLAAEYSSSLTTDIELRSPSGDFLKSSGTIKIDELSLKRGSLSLANKAPMAIEAQNGNLTIQDFKLEGPNSEISLRGSNFNAENLNVTATMNLDIRLLQIFLPFLEDLGGPVKTVATISGPYTRPTILGNLNCESAYFKIRDFPHPVERLSVDVAFSQSRILINSLHGQMAGGQLSGDGNILINGVRDLPLNLRLNLEGVTLNVPDKVRTSGNANLMLTGKWFPFTLSGTYQIFNALVEMEFGGANASSSVRQSYYLPKVIRESSFEPLLLDIQLIMEQNIVVRNSLIDGSVEGRLRVKGPPRHPVLLGKINTQKNSKLIFKDKIFTIQTGDIDFSDPDDINPTLYVSATSRIDEYDLTVLAQGPSKNVTIRLTSVPPLPETDIISLIALGVTNSNLQQNLSSRDQGAQLGLEIGGAVLAKPINQQLENTLGLQFQVTNSYDSTRNISMPKITLSRRVSDRIKFSGSRSTKDSQYYDIKMEYLLNSNVTAIGSFENRGFETETGTAVQQEAQGIFGLDLEYKREFK